MTLLLLIGEWARCRSDIGAGREDPASHFRDGLEQQTTPHLRWPSAFLDKTMASKCIWTQWLSLYSMADLRYEQREDGPTSISE